MSGRRARALRREIRQIAADPEGEHMLAVNRPAAVRDFAWALDVRTRTVVRALRAVSP